MGRKKTQMKMIQGGNARQVSFSKRRSGIFKKASELCTLCTVETALVVFSPGGKAFSFGHPCFEAIMKRLADAEPRNPDPDFAQHMAEHEATLSELNKQYSDALKELEAEKKRGKELKQMREAQGMPLLDKPIEELNLDELETLKAFLEQVKGNLLKRLGELSVQTSNMSASSENSAEAIDPRVTNPTNTHDHGISHEN
ncbi:hypothetical protein P3X46_012656 [Hevea brasiliensis]|uniref:MADS-box domain-containing protein n=1 Tax=Hevea brasiliensis TaxID=3981 RepID=A0ABQ9MD01_HEVBR|nr:agamous-like MADS-box protein AGL29 [Hevea brasiliensis]KAJ9177435.1 hypothetical protein P3X46_012656 [Hevea brasiliensis]